jgi:hypothetical protein
MTSSFSFHILNLQRTYNRTIDRYQPTFVSPTSQSAPTYLCLSFSIPISYFLIPLSVSTPLPIFLCLSFRYLFKIAR